MKDVMVLKVAKDIADLKNTESSITVTDLEVFFHALTVTIYSTTITLRPTHGDAATTIINGEN